jgi:hypothetical protein
MGSDIDLFVEKRNSAGKWELMFPPPGLAEQLHGEHEMDRKYGPDHMPGWAWYSRRNYRLFGLLADVRGSIDSPWSHRGIPKDSPIEALDHDDRIGRSRWDGHSHSYVTLAELKAYDWGTVVEHWDGTRVPVETACGWFVNHTLPTIEKELGVGPEDIRLVYWFDC